MSDIGFPDRPAGTIERDRKLLERCHAMPMDR